MKLMIPFIPHLANECLELHNCASKNTWPEINSDNILTDIKLAVQVNGKTRDILTVKKDLSENEINEIVLKNSKATKFIKDKEIIKSIFVKNKILNYIVRK